jgi:hypothetical protein
VGKTTLAQRTSDIRALPFLRTQTSGVFLGRGLDPAQPMSFETRLSVQRDILAAAESLWVKASDPFISDRTPLDMAAYTLADVQGATRLDSAALLEYLDDCMTATNRFFDKLIIVPPGIPLVQEPGKAALNQAYIEHVHTLVVGLCHDPRITGAVHLLPRDIVSLEERVQRIAAILNCS